MLRSDVIQPLRRRVSECPPRLIRRLINKASALKVNRPEVMRFVNENVKGFAVPPHNPGAMNTPQYLCELRPVEQDFVCRQYLIASNHRVEDLAVDGLKDEEVTLANLEIVKNTRDSDAVGQQSLKDPLLVPQPRIAVLTVPIGLAICASFLDHTMSCWRKAKIDSFVDPALTPLRDMRASVPARPLGRVSIPPDRALLARSRAANTSRSSER